MSLIAALAIWLFMPDGEKHSLAFIAGYLIEESLSVDNLFVFLMLLGYF